MTEPHKCLAGCGRVITWQFAICTNCEKMYGSSPYDWPDWLRYLWQDTQKERRKERKKSDFEISFDFDYM
jgi:hypothetical protein